MVYRILNLYKYLRVRDNLALINRTMLPTQVPEAYVRHALIVLVLTG